MNYPGRLFCLSSLLTLLSHSLSSLRPGLTPSTESAPQCAEDEEEEYRGGRNGMEWNEEENRREEEGNYTINGPSEGEREEKGDGEERHGVRREMRLTGTRLERRGEMRKRDEESGMHHSSNDTMQSIPDFAFSSIPRESHVDSSPVLIHSHS